MRGINYPEAIKCNIQGIRTKFNVIQLAVFKLNKWFFHRKARPYSNNKFFKKYNLIIINTAQNRTSYAEK